MPKTITSIDLTKGYNEISEFCHSYQEPVFVNVNGKDDLVIMSTELYNLISNKAEIYSEIDKGLDDIRNGRVKPASDVLGDPENIKEKANEIIDKNIDAFKELSE